MTGEGLHALMYSLGGGFGVFSLELEEVYRVFWPHGART